jgi:hypothetical protein
LYVVLYLHVNLHVKLFKDLHVNKVKMDRLMDLNREIVLNDYTSACKMNQEQFIKGDIKAGSEYIYQNQKFDAMNIIDILHDSPVRAVSIIKRTKVGMDGLMIEIAKNITTHPDPNFAIHRENIFFITGMNNVIWETSMKDKIPNCFRENVFHHGKLQKIKFKHGIKDAVIIIDELDTGDKEDQKLHNILKSSGILNIRYMLDNNIRLIVCSATMKDELDVLKDWGIYHREYRMTIPESYIGHKEFLELGIIKEFYPVDTEESAEKWLREDVLEYSDDIRVHIIRTDKQKVDFIQNACFRLNVEFKNHTSTERLSDDELTKLFSNLTKHVVIAVKGLWRRSDYFPNEHKKKIGATHERYIKNYDANVLEQGLPGRLSGYWKDIIMSGHKTGPYRTSIDSVKEYEEFYKNPFCNAFSKKSKKLFMNPKNISYLESTRAIEETNKRVPIIIDNLSQNDTIFSMNTKEEKIKRTLELIKDSYPKLYSFIMHEDTECAQTSKPKTDTSIKKHITDVVHASINNKPYSVDLKPKFKTTNNWSLFIDNIHFRLCIVVWSLDHDLY